MKNKFYALVLVFGVAISLTSKAQTQGTAISTVNSGTSPLNGIPATAKPLNPKDVSPEIKKLLKYYDKQIYFTENKGQWDNSILYKAEFPLGNAVVTSEGVQMSDYDPADVNARYKWGIAQEQAKKDHVPFNEPMVKVKTHEWLMKFANSSPDMKIGGQSKHSDVFNYFIGNVAATNVANYQEVWYNNVYKNVDVRYYPSAEGALEYDIVCKPGFDKKQIAIQLDGINKMQLTKDGGLVLTTRVGNMNFPAPVAYQKIDGKQVAVKAKYRLDNNEITFDLGKYDASLPLIIDPIALRWATWVNLGSTGDDHGHGIWVDNDGSIYVVSRVDGSATLETGGLETSAAGGIDLVVGKYLEPAAVGGSGTRVWQTYIGGSQDDNPYALEEGPDGNIYIVGYTESTDFPLSAGSAFGGASIDDRAQTTQNIFITKITPVGTSIKSAVIGGNGTDDAFDLRIDPTTNNIVVCGNTSSTNLATLFPSTGAVNRSNSNQGTDILVFKINSDLSSILWMKNYGGTGSDIANIMLQNPVNGDLFVAGSTTSSNFPVSTNAREKTLVGAQDGFVQKLNSSGTVEWSSYFNSATSTTSKGKTTTYSSSILCMEFNPSYNQVYFGGITTGLYTGGTGAANNISTGALRTAYNGGDHDFFITNMDTAQNLIASTYLGGTDDEVNLMGLNVDASSNVFIFGYSASKSASPATTTSFPVTSDALQQQNAGGDDKVFCKISSDLKTELYGTFYGGANDDYDPIGERGIKFANCRIYTIVTSESFDIPLTVGALNVVRATGDNHYEPGLVVWANPPDFLSNTITGKQTVICAGSKPDSIIGSPATYSLPQIVRNSPTGNPTAYPVTYPAATYQWAYSTDSVTFTNIVGATNQNLPGGVNGLIPVLTQKTYFKREISGDACVIAGAANQVVTIQTVGVSGVVTNVTCNGFSNGSITVTGVGTAPFKFKWYNGSTNATISGLAAGTYSITTTDGTSCTGVNSFIVSQPSAALTVVPNTTSPATCGAANGSGSVAASGGTIPYNYTWSPSGPNGPSLTGLSGGTYYITVTDKNSCTASTSIVVGQPETITATITPTNPLCNGGSTGTITIVPSGGVGGYTYAWSNGASTQNLSNIPSTSYSVTITDANGCNAIQSTLLSDPAALTINPTSTPVTCNGGSNGTASAGAGGGTPGYTYHWSNGGSTSTISNLSAIAYNVTVTDAHGCTIGGQTTVGTPTALTINPTSTPVTCNGGSNGTASAGAGGGTPSYTYNWSNGGSTPAISNLSAIAYNVTVTDAHGCTIGGQTTVGTPTALTINPTSTPVTCNGGSNGTASAGAGGGTPSYTYNWSNGGTTPSITGLSSTTYFVTVTDSHGCTGNGQVLVNQPQPIVITSTHTDPLCAGYRTGSIKITSVTGGTPYSVPNPPYKYHWNDNETTSSISGLNPDIYNVVVVDANNCTAVQFDTITAPLPLSLSPSSTDANCHGSATGTASVLPTGGTRPYSYNWSNNQADSSISGLTAATYFVTVTDANGCSGITQATVNQPDTLIVIPIPTNLKCFNDNSGRVTLNINDGGTLPYTYKWTNNGTMSSIMFLDSGKYCVTVTDARGCTVAACTEVTQPDSLIAPITSTNITCHGANNGTVTVTTSGGTQAYSYNWNPSEVNNSNLTGLGAGTYSVTVTDANNCTATASASVINPDTVLITVGPVQNVSCAGAYDGSADIHLGGGTNSYSFVAYFNGAVIAPPATLDSGDETLGPLTGGQYCLVITDGNGCKDSTCITITQPDTLKVIDTTIVPVACSGSSTGSVSITVSGGTPTYSYNWSNGGTTSSITGLVANNYTVTVTDAHGCSLIQTYNVNEPKSLSLGGTSTDASCKNGSDGTITLSVTGGNTPYNYNWSPPEANSGTLSGLTEGGYSVTVTDANNCTQAKSFTIGAPLALKPGGTSTNASCHNSDNGTITLAFTGGTTPYSYNWSPAETGTTNLTGLSAATYAVTVTDAHGCTADTSFNITQPDTLIVSANPTALTCFNNNTGRVTLDINDGGTMPYSYKWSNNTTMSGIMFLDSGKYCVTVTDAHGCTVGACAEVTQPDSLQSPITSTDVTCHGLANGTVTVTPTGGTQAYSYNWSPTETNAAGISGLIAGTYNVTVTDANNCTATAVATVNQPDTLLINIATVVNVSCYNANNGSIFGNVTGGNPLIFDSYGLNTYFNGTPQPSSYVSFGVISDVNLPAGQYCFVVTDYKGCKDSTCATITQPDTLTVVGQPTNATCNGTPNGTITTTVAGGTTPYTFSWSNGATSQNLSGLSQSMDTVTVTDAHGCTATAIFNITQPGSLTLGGTPTSVTCYGLSNGSVNLTVGGGTVPYSFSWNNGSTNQNLSNLTAGFDTVTVTDAGNCSAVKIFNVGQPDTLIAPVTSTDVTCHSGNNGSATLSVTGGTQAYSYNWSPAELNAASISGLSFGVYNVTVTDANNCTATAVATVNQPDTVLITVSNIDSVSCNAGQDGSAFITFGGGTGSYTLTSYVDGFELGSGNTFAGSFADGGLPAGQYCFKIVDGNGCSDSTCFTIYEPAPVVVADTVIKNALCYGSKTGSIAITVTGGTTPYTYNWNNGDTTSEIDTLSAGNYTVTITDAHSCTEIETYTVGQPDTLTIIPQPNNVSCHGVCDGSILLTVSGGTTPIGTAGGGAGAGKVLYNITWDQAITGFNPTGLCAGTYCYTVTDANNCSKSGCINITEPDALTLGGSSTPANCSYSADGSINLTVDGGTSPYTFSWSNGSTNQNLSNLASGTDTVTVTDLNNCTAVKIFNVDAPTPINPSISHVNTNTCTGVGCNGSINLTVGGGTAPYTFNWSNGATDQNISGLCQARYYVTITDATGCTAITNDSVDCCATSITITKTLSPTFVLAPANDWQFTSNIPGYASFTIPAAGGSIVLTGMPFATYTVTETPVQNWIPSNTCAVDSNIASITVNTCGNYTCAFTNTERFTPPCPFPIKLDSVNVACQGGNTGAVSVILEGGFAPYTYTWSNGATTPGISGLVAATYCVTVTDVHSCLGIACIKVNDGIQLSVTPTATPATCSSAPNCNGFTTFSQGGYHTTCHGGNPGCIRDADFPIAFPNGVVFGCTGKDTVLLKTSGDVATFLPGTGGPGVLTGSAINPTGGNVFEGQLLTAILTVGFDDSIPDFSSNTLHIKDLIYTGSGSFNGWTVQQIIDTANKVIGGCSTGYSASSLSDALDNINNNYDGGTSDNGFLTCSPSGNGGGCNGSILVQVSGGTPQYSINWDNSSASGLNPMSLCPGTYNLTVTDAHGCSATSSATVNQPSPLVITPSETDASCNNNSNGTASVSVTGGSSPYTYLWSNGKTTSGISGLAANTYDVTVTDKYGCTGTGETVVNQPDALTATPDSTDVTCNGGNNGTASVSVTGGTTPYTYYWSNGQTGASISGLTAAVYGVTVTDAHGCTAATSTNVDQPTAINPTISHTNTNTCTGIGCNGSITLTVDGGVSPYTFNWSNGSTSQNISGLCQARYFVTITDAHGCTATTNDSVDCCPTSITITKVLAPTLALAPGTDWQFTSNIPGEASFTLPAGGGSVTFTGMPLGQYTITETPSEDWIPSNDNAVDSNTAVISLLTCGGSPTVTFTNTQRGTPPCPTPLAIALDSTNVSCNGASNGSINLTTNTGAGTYTYNWSNGASTRNISGLAGNTYCVTVTYTQGCSSSATACITVNEPAQLRSFIVCPALQCAGNCNGTATVSEVGGTPPYTFHWNTGATDSTISNLCANVYSVTVTDAHGCTAISATQLIGPNSLTVTNAQTNASCHGYCDGTDTAIVSGGTTPYSYNWSNGQTSETATGLCGGITYTVTVTDAGGCTQTKTVTITEPDGLTAMVTGTDISCHGSKDGTATVTAHGGTQAYTYLWSNGATASSISGLDSATYCVTVTDAHGCTAGGCVTVGEPGQLLVTAMCLHNDCASQCIGALELTVFGGTRPYRYHWMGSGLTDSTITGLCVGLYTVMVTDAHGCNVLATFEIHANTPLSVTTVATNSNNCSQNGACNGTITANPSGATPPYAYIWSNGQTGQTATGLCNARYYVTVTDSHGYGCATTVATDSVGCNCNSGSITITKVISPANALPPASWTFTSNIPNNSTFIINGTGGTQVFNNLPLGIYTVTEISNPNWTPSNTCGPDTNVAVINVSSCNNFTCTFTNTAKFRVPCNIAITLDSTNVNCNGNHTGSATVSIVGGSAGATYAWSNGGTTASITGLGAATYTVTVTAASGCTAIGSTTVNQPNTLTASATGTNVSCHGGNNGTATLTVNGGTLSYTYHWSNGASTQNLSNLTANTYYVTVTDAHGCKAYASICITQPQTLTAYINGTNVTCNGGNNGAANLTVNGGTQPYSYHWSNGSSTQDLSNLTAATYYVTVTDAHDCIAYGTICITQNPPLYLTVTPTNCTSSGDCHTGCNGKVSASVTGGEGPYRYHWSTGANTATISNECGGTYYVTVTDYAGCVKTGNATIVCIPVCNITLSSTCQHNLCYGEQSGSINLTVNNAIAPITYIWSNGKTTQDISGLAAGSYSVTVTDKNKCSATGTYTINQNPAITLTVTPTNCTSSGDCHTGCNGKIVASATGGVAPYRYHWSTGANTSTINNECGGTYYVTVTDYDGCVKTGNATIVCIPVCNITLSSQCQHNLCYGEQIGSINLTVNNATAPITYIWSNGKTTQDINGLAAGSYSVTVTDKNKCSATGTYTINQNTAISLTTSYTNCTTSRDCHNGCNGKVSVSATGGVAPYRYRWSTGDNTSSVNNLCGGTYYITVTDYDGCAKTTSVNIVCIPVCNITLSGSCQHNLCYGEQSGSINLSVNNAASPITYKWSNGKTTQDLNNLGAGTYSVTVTDANKCSATTSFTINQNPVITLTVTPTNCTSSSDCHTGCNGQATASATGGVAPYRYKWSTGCNTATVNNLCGGTYYVTVTDYDGCTKVCTVTITCISPCNIKLSATTQSVECNGGYTGGVNLSVSGGSSPYYYKWSNGKATQDINNLCAGSYTVTVTDSKGCSATATYTVSGNSVINITISHTNTYKVGTCTTLCNGTASAYVTGGDAPYHYHWSTGSNSSSINGLCANCTYYLTVTDNAGCSKVTCVTILSGTTYSSSARIDESQSQTSDTSSTGSLSMNTYPNPFMTEANIEIISPVTTNGMLQIVDISGRIIQVIYNGNLDAGIKYSFVLHGENLGSGMYFCRLITNEAVYTNNMIKVK